MSNQNAQTEKRYRTLLNMLDHTGRNGLSYEANEEEHKVVLYVPAGLVRVKCTFYVHDEDGVITLHIGTNVYADDKDARLRVLVKMNEYNYKYIQGRLYIDTIDNEIMFSDGVRFEDVMPSEEMLRGMLLAGVSSVRRSIESLVREILCPEQPEEKPSDSLEAALAQLLNSDDDGDDDDDDDDDDDGEDGNAYDIVVTDDADGSGDGTDGGDGGAPTDDAASGPEEA